MTSTVEAGDLKSVLHRYYISAREALLWKLDGLEEYDLRRPMTPTGTNLLGLVKHVASVTDGYLGDSMGRPSGIELPWYPQDPADEVPNADLWVPADESRAFILDLYQRVARHADETIEALPLDAAGTVPWWGERGDVTLGWLLVHVTTEINRHAGHADIIRELIDGSVGHRAAVDNMWSEEGADYWDRHRARIEEGARAAQAAAQAATQVATQPATQPATQGSQSV